MISTLNDIKQGMTLLYKGEPHLVLKANFVRMQQRQPVMQTKMRNLVTGKVIEYNFKAGEKVEEADIARQKVNFLYKAGDEFIFMDNTNYEQFSLTKNKIGDKEYFLKEGDEITLISFRHQPIALELPPKIDLKVVSTVEGVKGDTAQGRVTKPATVETGYTLNVPLFVKEGDIIRINTETGEYVERV